MCIITEIELEFKVVFCEVSCAVQVYKVVASLPSDIRTNMVRAYILSKKTVVQDDIKWIIVKN